MLIAGLYVVYNHKNLNGRDHLATAHSRAGMGVIVSCIGAGMAGGVFLHPDFGVDKTNQQIRGIHKWFARTALIAAWFTAFLGMTQLTQDEMILALYGVPLILLVPFVLM